MENENKNIENKNETTPNIEKSKIETIKDLEKQASEIQAKLEKLKNESKEYENKNISKIDNNISELGLTENEETISVKKEIGGIEQNKQNTIDSGINEIKKITYETSTSEKINEENTADFITEFNRMKREADTEKMMKEIEEEDLENELQKKKEEEFFEKFKNGENLEEENNKLKEYTEGNTIKPFPEGISYKVIKTAEDKGSYYLAEIEPIYEQGLEAPKNYHKDYVEIEKNQDGSIGKIIFRPDYLYKPRESQTIEQSQENSSEKKEIETLSLEEEYKKTQEEEALILEELGKLKEGEKPSRELEERNLVNEAKLRDLENKINENNSEKGEVFYPGDTVEFDGDKIIKVEKSKEEEIILTPEEVKTEKPKETGTENSKEATNENKETATSPELNEEEMNSVINPKNQEGFKKLSKKSQSFMSKVYSGLIKIPVANRFIGKMEIAYNQFLFDKKEKQRLELKSKLYGLETKSETLDEVKRLNQETAEFLEGIDPNAKNRVEKESAKIDKEKDKIDTQIDKINSKISQKEISLGIFKNRRDAVVDRLITNYEIKASPLEGQLNLLSRKREEVEEICNKTEIEISKAENRINILKISRDSAMENLSKYLSGKDIDKNEAIKSLNNNIDRLYLSIQEKRNQIAEEKDKIDTQINKKLKKISPYVIKKNELLRIKSRGVADIDFSEIATEYKNSENNSKKEEIEKNKEELKFEKSDSIENTIGKYIKFLKENNAKEGLNIDIKEFTERTELPSKNIIKLSDFKKIIELIYEEKGIKEEEYINIIDKI